ncbi:hypothetical protein, partial [Microcystis sp. M017S1]|uniref:hypothetical protein n=1 Tax=Microcystis sp. M017S1 TaxID=2771107 RepID=UPI0025882FEE
GRKRNFTHSKSDKAKAHDNHALKEQQQGRREPRKKQAAPCTENRKNKPTRYAPTKVAKHATPKTERTSL